MRERNDRKGGLKSKGTDGKKTSLPFMTVGYFMFGCVRKYKFRVTCGEFVPPPPTPLLGGEGLDFTGDAFWWWWW